MSKLLYAVLVLLLVACSAYAGQPYFSDSVNATDTNTNVSITGIPQNIAHTVIIINDGPSEAYFNLTDGVATVSGAAIESGESLTITSGNGSYPMTNIGIVCDTSETATVRIFAFPSKGE